MKDLIKARIEDVKHKIKVRSGMAGYESNVEALRAALGELESILALAEEQDNV